jgi:hypothetical protein
VVDLMNNDRRPATEQAAPGAPAAAAPPEWARQQERLVDVIQALVGAVTELSAAVGRMATRVDEMYTGDEKD